MRKCAVFFAAMFAIMFASVNSSAVGQTVKQKSFDIEVDPVSYAFNGFSVHGGYSAGPWRLDLGIYGLEFPDWLDGNDDFTSSFAGAGWKMDYFFKRTPGGWFAGLEGGVMRLEVTHLSTETERDRLRYLLGVRGGYRWNTGFANLYITPWLGLGFTLNARDMTVNGDTFELGVFQPFPTVHLGWTF